MSKKELDLDKLGVSKKMKVKKPDVNLDTDKAIQNIHKPKSEEKIKRISLDLPFSLYKEVKRKAIDEEITMKDYFVNLATKDLK